MAEDLFRGRLEAAKLPGLVAGRPGCPGAPEKAVFWDKLTL